MAPSSSPFTPYDARPSYGNGNGRSLLVVVSRRGWLLTIGLFLVSCALINTLKGVDAARPLPLSPSLSRDSLGLSAPSSSARVVGSSYLRPYSVFKASDNSAARTLLEEEEETLEAEEFTQGEGDDVGVIDEHEREIASDEETTEEEMGSSEEETTDANEEEETEEETEEAEDESTADEEAEAEEQEQARRRHLLQDDEEEGAQEGDGGDSTEEQPEVTEEEQAEKEKAKTDVLSWAQDEADKTSVRRDSSKHSSELTQIRDEQESAREERAEDEAERKEEMEAAADEDAAAEADAAEADARRHLLENDEEKKESASAELTTNGTFIGPIGKSDTLFWAEKEAVSST